MEDGTTPTLRLSLFSPDGEEGFPGNLSVTVTYTLGENNGLQLHYQAVSDQKTVLNLTNHSYFNLGGYASGPIYNHELWVDANTYLETDDGLIPTGSQICVTGTPFDFTSPKPLGREIFAENRDLHYAGGYDHCFHFTGGESKAPMHRATLYCPATGREMKLLTNQPCVHVYTANFMINACYPLKGGLPQRRHHAICLETERMPDSMNHSGFTNCVLDVGHAIVTGMDIGVIQQTLKERICAYHLHNNDGLHDLHDRLRAGVFDWTEFAKNCALYTPGATGVLEYMNVVELDAYTQDSLYLEKLINGDLM